MDIEKKPNEKLETILKIAQVFRTLCKVLFVLSVVGTCICAVSIILLASFGSAVIAVEDGFRFIIADVNVPLPTLYCYLALGILYCGVEIILTKLSMDYLDQVLGEGTVFSYQSAKKLRRHGICDIVLSFIEAILSGIIIEIASQHVEALDVSASVITSETVGFGVLLILFSFVCEYGASLTEKQ